MPLRLTTPPAAEPLTAAEARDHSRIDHDAEDGLLESLIRAWRQSTERATQRALITQEWELTLEAFPEGREAIRLNRPPVSAVTSLTYVDPNGDEQTMDAADYVLVEDEPARLYPAPGKRWPRAQTENPEAVTVTFTAGYGDAEDVPETLVDAIRLGVATRHEHREDVVVGHMVSHLQAIESIWHMYRWDVGVG